MAGRPIKREEASNARLEIRINDGMKKEFRTYCKEREVTAADLIVAFIKEKLEEDRKDR